MADTGDATSWYGKRAFMVGIKGTGMTALTELFLSRGMSVSGSDSEEIFYTDRILTELGVPIITSFDAAHLPDDTDLLVYSAAYDPEHNPQIREAHSRGLPVYSYPEALGSFSADVFAVAVAGVHGKTTTTAMLGAVVQESGLEGSVLVGSAVPSFGGRSTYVGGSRFFIAETCEYRRHFLSFHPDILLVTSIEADHLDYYRDYEDVFDAFLSYGRQLPDGGVLVYCEDDPGAASLAARLGSERPDLVLRPYGEHAGGAYAVREARTERGRIRFLLGEEESEYAVPVPGVHNALNAAAAAATLDALRERLGDGPDALNPGDEPDSAGTARGSTRAARIPRELLHRAFAGFRGTKRRSEVVGEASGVLFLDDYGHHPTAIAKTLEALRAFYPGRRFIVDFMSHTYSRTAALLDEFAGAFGEADIVITHKIYASARESYAGSVTGERLAEAIARKHPRVYHFPEVMDAWQFCLDIFRPGDVFLTLGAGNNWTLGKALFESLSAATQGSGTA